MRVGCRTSPEPPSTATALPTSRTGQHLQRFYNCIRRSAVGSKRREGNGFDLGAQAAGRSLSALLLQSSVPARHLYVQHFQQQQQRQQNQRHRRRDADVVAAGDRQGGGAGGARRAHLSTKRGDYRRLRWPLASVSGRMSGDKTMLVTYHQVQKYSSRWSSMRLISLAVLHSFDGSNVIPIQGPTFR